MPIIVSNLEDLLCPQVICDACDKTITDAGRAVAASRMDGKRNTVLYAHKGPCHQAVEALLGESLGIGWVELSEHLANLLHNTQARQLSMEE